MVMYDFACASRTHIKCMCRHMYASVFAFQRASDSVSASSYIVVLRLFPSV